MPQNPAQAASTPEVPELRDLHFESGDCDLRHWHPAGPHVCHFMNALSLFFPEGERFFIHSVRAFRDRIEDPKLRADVDGFIGQEAIHGREHRRYNEALEAAGLPVRELEEDIRQGLQTAREQLPPKDALAVTIALEHFTAILAAVLLRDPRILQGADPRLAALWHWHAIEETEHKAVAFDVYQLVTKDDRNALWRRNRAMVTITAGFLGSLFRFWLRLVRSDGIAGDPRGWWRVFRHMWITPGPMRQVIPAYLAYFRRDFHPWQQDNRRDLEPWKLAYEKTGRAPA